MSQNEPWKNPYVEPDLAETTRSAYDGDIAAFAEFCESLGIAVAMPADPSVISRYLASIATTHAIATLRRRLRGIIFAHRIAGYDLMATGAEIRQTMLGINRKHGKAQRRAAALGLAEVKAMIRTCPENLTGWRDRAIILVGFAGGLRRSEIVSIEREHLTFCPGTVRIFIPKSKGDQTGEGAEITIPAGQHEDTCPIRALQKWLEKSNTRFGPVFRGVDRWDNVLYDGLHPDGIRRIIIRAGKRANITISAHETLSPHGLRAGFVTEAHRRNARDEDIMRHTRHKSLAMMRGYIRRSDKIADNPAGKLGL